MSGTGSAGAAAVRPPSGPVELNGHLFGVGLGARAPCRAPGIGEDSRADGGHTLAGGRLGPPGPYAKTVLGRTTTAPAAMATACARVPTVRADMPTVLGDMPAALQNLWSSRCSGYSGTRSSSRSGSRSGRSGLRERRLGLSAYDRYVSGRGCSLGPFRLGVFSPLFHAHAHPPTGLFRVRRRP